MVLHDHLFSVMQQSVFTCGKADRKLYGSSATSLEVQTMGGGNLPSSLEA
jgi:hypothetical protein